MTVTKQISVDTNVKFDNVLVANIHHRCVTTSRTIRLSDLNVEIDHLPTGSRKLMQIDVIPSDITKEYENIIVRAKTLFQNYTAMCEIGYIVAHHRVTELREEMVALMKAIENRKHMDITRYEELCENHLKHIAADPAIAAFDARDRLLEVIKAKQPSWDEFDQGISLSYTLLAVGSAGEWDLDAYQDMQDSVVAIKKGAFGSLIQDLCATARNALEKAVKAENRVHSRTFKAVWKMVEKLGEFAFLDKRLRVVERELRSFLAPLHTGEALRGLEYEDFINIMSALGNQVLVCQKLDSGEPLIEVLEYDDGMGFAAGSPEPAAGQDADQQAYAAAFVTPSATVEEDVEVHDASAVEEAPEEETAEPEEEWSGAPVQQAPQHTPFDNGF